MNTGPLKLYRRIRGEQYLWYGMGLTVGQTPVGGVPNGRTFHRNLAPAGCPDFDRVAGFGGEGGDGIVVPKLSRP